MGNAAKTKRELTLTECDLQVLRRLTQHGVRAIVVGGRAVQFYTRSREADDLDLLVHAEGAEKLVEALRELGCSIKYPAEVYVLPGKQIPIKFRGFNVELLTSIQGMDFETMWNDAVAVNSLGLRVMVVARPDLIRAKRASGRPEDLADAELLERQAKEGA